jgi:gliding motility-associated-like protein
MKQNLLIRMVLCCLALLGLTGLQQAHADHLAAVDLSAEYIGTGPTDMRYLITLKVYKICEPDYGTIGNYPTGPYTMNLQLFSTDYVTVKSATTTPTFTNSVQVNQVGGEDTLDQLCGTYKSQNSCRNLANFVQYPGFLRRTYQATYTVPNNAHPSDLTFYWSSCCRNAGVQNITNTGGSPVSGAGIYVEAVINTALRYNNSTPAYTADPIPYICANRIYNYVNAPVDKDLDSLYSINFNARTFGAPPTNLPFATGYNLGNPISSASSVGYNVNTVTGTATFNPQNTGKYVLAFKTEDHDKTTGALLGYITRDVQVSVLPCAGVQDPTIDTSVQAATGIKSIDNNILYVCPGTPISFQVSAKANNTPGTIILRPLLSSILPVGLTYTNVGNYTTSATTTFNWTPTAADYGDHIIALEALDSGCAASVPIVPKVYFVFTIRVLGPGLDAGPDQLVCPLGERPVRIGPVNSNPNFNYTWTNTSGAVAEFLDCTDCMTAMAAPPYNYDYVVTTDDPKQACKASDTVNVSIDTSVRIKAPQEPLLICRPTYYQLVSQAYGPAPYANIPCGLADPITCTTDDTAIIGKGQTFPNAPSNTPFYTSKTFTKYQFIIPKAEILKAGFYSGTINGMAFQSIASAINGANPIDYFYISLACVPFETFPTPVNNNSFYPNATQVLMTTNVVLTPNAWNQLKFDAPYSWDTSKNLLVDICIGPQTVNASGIEPVSVVPGAAIQKSDNGINVCGGNATSVSLFNERPVVRFNFCPTPVLPFEYRWDSGNNLNDSNVQNPLAYVARSINYAVYTIGRNGCRVRDSLHITVPDHKLTVGPIDTIACLNQIVPLHARGGDAYQWYTYSGGVFGDASQTLTCTNCADPVATPPVTTSYAVVFSNNVHQTAPVNPTYETGCPDTMMLTVFVNPLPNVRIDNADTQIKYGKSVQLYAHGAQWYSWKPAGSLNDPNSPGPIARPTETTTYVVYGKDMNGCVASDSVLVSVDYRDNLLVPTAFTPNGDGMNDVFKPVNLGLRKLMEFRVFNRWGQEVFSTTDHNAGWDGKWKGEDAPIGSYQYIIRIGYPDQMTESFKGDVTLIR